MKTSGRSKTARKRHDVVGDIVERLVRRHSTAVVLLHHAVAQRLGLGPTDHKCLDLLREREALSGTEMAGITGLTTGAITGVVARLERAGYLRREAHPRDGRKQILSPAADRMKDIHAVFEPIREASTAMLEGFDRGQQAAIAEFLDRSADLAYRQVALFRAHTVDAVTGTRSGEPASRPRLPKRAPRAHR